MPTYESSDSFRRDYKALSVESRALFKASLREFIEDLTGIESGVLNDFRGSLRVKSMRKHAGIMAMTWEGGDGRATFEYGTPLQAGKRHIKWRRIGGHEVLGAP